MAQTFQDGREISGTIRSTSRVVRLCPWAKTACPPMSKKGSPADLAVSSDREKETWLKVATGCAGVGRLGLSGNFGLEGGVAELHRFEDDIFDGAAGGNHGKNVFGVRNHDVEDVGGFRGEQALKRGADLFGLGNAFRRNPEALADRKVVGEDCFRGIGIAEEGVATVAGEEAIFPLNNHPKVLVIDNDGLGGDVFGDGGG